ncbi:MAG: hypothetical protein Q9184_005791 [Pyrenodesmia sp. 2 TL-2023]
MVTGFSQYWVLEQPVPRFSIYGVENADLDTKPTVTNVLANLDNFHDESCLDLEMVEKDNLPYTQRFVPEVPQHHLPPKAGQSFGEIKPANSTLAFAPEVDIAPES